MRRGIGMQKERRCQRVWLALASVVYGLSLMGCATQVRDVSASENAILKGDGLVSQYQGRLIVVYFQDHGYKLIPVNTNGVAFVPDFLSPAMIDQFNSASIQAAKSGKRLFCDCKGQVFEREGWRYIQLASAALSLE